MASTDSDLQTDLRKRARRRLLGAIALALTAAIVLPIVMDHEPRPPAQDIAVRIPTRDAAPPLASPARDAQPDADTAEPAPPPAPPDSEPLPASRNDARRSALDETSVQRPSTCRCSEIDVPGTPPTRARTSVAT